MNREELLAKANEAFQKVLGDMLEQAYQQGYEEGCKVKDEYSDEPLDDHSVEWVDFNLPSGNLWKKVDFQTEKYPENDKYIPTIDDIKELLEYAYLDVSVNNGWLNRISIRKNSASIKLGSYYGFYERNNVAFLIWLKSKVNEKGEHRCARIFYDGNFEEGTKPNDRIKLDKEFYRTKGIWLYCKKNN